MSRATLKSLAKATGFSITTVSRALGGFDDVNSDTRRLILEEAQRQCYEPNQQARALQKRRVQTVGLVLDLTGPRFPDPFFGEFIGGVGAAVSAAGFDLLLSTHDDAGSELDAYRRLIGGRRVDGLIVLRARLDDARIRYLQTAGIPFVVFGRSLSGDPYVYIDIDGKAGQSILTQHLIDNGHRRIAYITPPRHLTFTYYRCQGFYETMSANGLDVPDEYVIESDLTDGGGANAARYLLNLPTPPTAIMAGNDLGAIGVMSVIQERGSRVGPDIAVGGFDDVPLAEHIHPGLTTIRQPIYNIGQQLAQMLLRQLNGEHLAETEILMSPELVVRASSGSKR